MMMFRRVIPAISRFVGVVATLTAVASVAGATPAAGSPPAANTGRAADPEQPAKQPAGPKEASPDQASADQASPDQASLDQTWNVDQPAKVGQRLRLELRVDHPADATVHLPDSFGNARWELSDTIRDVSGDETRKESVLTLIFQIFRPGPTTLPAFGVTVLGADGQTTTLETDPIDAKIVSVLPADKTPELSNARDPVAVWTDDYTLVWTGGILVGGLLIAGLTALFMRRRRVDAPGPPPRPAHLVALEKLSALTTDELLDDGHHMQYYVRMSEAVREYLGRRYGFRGTELTTTEILGHLGDMSWPAGLSGDDIRRWLAHVDLVKFSGHAPERERAEQALRRGFSIVELTKASKDEQQDDHAENKQSAQADGPDEEGENSAETRSDQDQYKPEQDAPEQNAPEQNAPEQNAPEQNAPEQDEPEQDEPEQTPAEREPVDQDKPTLPPPAALASDDSQTPEDKS